MTPHEPWALSRSRLGVRAASLAVRPLSTSWARSASPSNRTTTIGYTAGTKLTDRSDRDRAAVRDVEAVSREGRPRSCEGGLLYAVWEVDHVHELPIRPNGPPSVRI